MFAIRRIATATRSAAEQGQINRVTAAIPPEMLQQYISEVHRGNCPKCGAGAGQRPYLAHGLVDARDDVYEDASAGELSAPCGVKAKLSAAVSSGVFGWWAFPWGFFVTPLQIMRNVKGIFAKVDSSWPSQQLAHLVKLDLAKRASA